MLKRDNMVKALLEGAGGTLETEEGASQGVKWIVIPSNMHQQP